MGKLVFILLERLRNGAYNAAAPLGVPDGPIDDAFIMEEEYDITPPRPSNALSRSGVQINVSRILYVCCGGWIFRFRQICKILHVFVLSSTRLDLKRDCCLNNFLGCQYLLGYGISLLSVACAHKIENVQLASPSSYLFQEGQRNVLTLFRLQ